ncbi:hypothetical protein LINPERHAP1_LOCUS34665 [Linum perenne]
MMIDDLFCYLVAPFLDFPVIRSFLQFSCFRFSVQFAIGLLVECELGCVASGSWL